MQLFCDFYSILFELRYSIQLCIYLIYKFLLKLERLFIATCNAVNSDSILKGLETVSVHVFLHIDAFPCHTLNS